MAGGWGIGPDAVGLLDTYPSRELEGAALVRSRDWRRLVFDSGFAWLSGPTDLGGGGHSAEFDEAYRLLEREFDVPDQQPFATGTHLVAPAVRPLVAKICSVAICQGSFAAISLLASC